VSDTYQPTTEPAAAPPPAAPPPSPSYEPAPPPNPPVGPVAGVSSTYSGESYDDRGQPKVHHGPETAARELARRRSERQQGPQEFLEEFVEPVQYIDGRPADQEVDAKDAARDLSDYRAQRNAQLKAVLDELEGTPQQQPGVEAQQQPEPAATPVDEYQAARAQHEPVVRENIRQLREALEQQESFAQSLGLEVPPGPHQEALQQFNAGVQAAEAARQNYELMVTAAVLGSEQAAAEFNSIRTPQDLERFKSDPAAMQRYSDWAHRHGALQRELAQVRAQGQQIAAHQQAQFQEQAAQQFKAYSAQQEKLAEARIPEIAPTADPNTRMAFQQGVLNTLQQTYRFGQDELAAAWSGKQSVSMRDHRVQELIADAYRWRQAQAKALQAQVRFCESAAPA
jgi:hypothetical protein